jgi:hypothetical protein
MQIMFFGTAILIVSQAVSTCISIFSERKFWFEAISIVLNILFVCFLNSKYYYILIILIILNVPLLVLGFREMRKIDKENYLIVHRNEKVL